MRTLLALLALLVVGAIAEATILPAIADPFTTTTTTLACQEDEPCWDCSTMGNLVCGKDHR